MLQANGDKHAKSWGSEMDSKKNSVSEVSNIKTIKNTITEETSYINSNTSKTDNMVDNATSRLTHTRTYILEKLPKGLLFGVLNDNDANLVFPVPKFVGSKKLLLIDLHVKNVWNFDSRKSFALDVELSAIPGKTSDNKLLHFKKIFYQIDGFGGAFTLLKFPGIIRLSFTLESSLKKARNLAVSKKILVNNKVRKVNTHLDQESVLMRKNSVRVALVVGDKQTWILKNYYQALLYTLPISTIAHNLFELLASYGGKTCFINHNPVLYACNRCAVVCFDSEELKNDTIGSLPVFRSVNLRWAGLSLACCAKYE
ncbi:hypothetical protein G9A89_008143 [Geosiphon pyriformis]|nr:hypothetical protein G9A89_008143 [Geosiphon pyriformis]